MNSHNCRSADFDSFVAVSSVTAQFVREARKRIKQRLIEQKAWRELIEVDDLTINGAIILKDGQLFSRHHPKKRK